MNSFQKSVLVVSLATFFVIASSFGIYIAWQGHLHSQQEDAARVAELRVQWQKDNIRSLKDLSSIGTLSSEEQERLDKAGDDVDRMQQVLLDLHEGRITYWREQLRETQERGEKLRDLNLTGGYSYYPQFQEAAVENRKESSKAEAEVIAYQAALKRTHAWRPVPFETYAASHASTSVPTGVINAGTSEKPSAFSNQPMPDGGPTEAAPVLRLRTASTTSIPSVSEPASEPLVLPAEVRRVLQRWSAAMIANDSAAEAAEYAPHLDRYFLKTDTDNAFVRLDKQAFLDQGNHITALTLDNISLEQQNANDVELSLVKDVTFENGARATHRLIRSRLHLHRFDDAWKITSERDFR